MSVNIFNKSTGSITQIAGNATGGGGTTVTVDNILSTTSENPVQNKVITGELNKKIDSSIKGVANGVAELDSNGKVLTAQLPSYVDDVLEYSGISDFPTEGETGKIYVDTTTNKTYRWSGSTYIEISESIALGETSSTAYRGDRGKIAYDHSQSPHAPADAEANVQSDWNETDTTSDTYIKNKPTTLPANGGNADTVGNKGISQILAVKGWFDGDMDNLKEQGSYIVNGATNMPIPSGWGTVLVFVGGTGSVVQMFTAYVTSPSDLCKTYIRHFTGDLWSTWVNIADGGNASTIGGKSISQLMSYGMAYGDRTQITSGDLDNYHTAGRFIVKDGATAAGIANSAFASAGYFLDVFYRTATITIQIAYTWSAIIKIRYSYVEDTVTKWSSWKNIADGGNADTLDGMHASDITLSFVNKYKPLVVSVAPTSNSVIFGWLPVDGATKYAVARYDPTTQKYINISTEITNTNYTVTGLSSDTTYQFLVQAWVNNQWSTFTTSDHIITNTLPGNISAGTADLSAGVSKLATGAIYLVYE